MPDLLKLSLNFQLLDYMMVGIEDIAGLKGKNYIRHRFPFYNLQQLKFQPLSAENFLPFYRFEGFNAKVSFMYFEGDKKVTN